VKSFILQDGRFVPDEGYKRGSMILYPEEEWRRRSDLMRRHHIRFQMLVVTVSLLLPTLIMSSMVLLPWARNDAIIVALLVTSLVMVGGLIIFSRMMIHRFDRGPLMGLYERGYQLDYEEFYPYEEMGRLEPGKNGLQIVVRRNGVDVDQRWISRRLVMTVLGEEGVEELERRVAGPGWAEQGCND
jgi:hypothetical protein